MSDGQRGPRPPFMVWFLPIFFTLIAIRVISYDGTGLEPVAWWLLSRNLLIIAMAMLAWLRLLRWSKLARR